MAIHFSCPRCDYTTFNKQSFIAHLNRKLICSPIKNDVNLDEMKVIYIQKHHNISCNQCKRLFMHRSSLSRHKKECATSIDITNILMENQSIMLRDIKKLQTYQAEQSTTPVNQTIHISLPQLATNGKSSSIAINNSIKGVSQNITINIA